MRGGNYRLVSSFRLFPFIKTCCKFLNGSKMLQRMESLLAIMKWVSSGVYLAVMLPFHGNHLLSFKITLMHNPGTYFGEFHNNLIKILSIKREMYEISINRLTAWPRRLLCFNAIFLNRITLQGKLSPCGSGSFTRELLEADKCYMLDCDSEIFVWLGRLTSVTERKTSISAAEVRTPLCPTICKEHCAKSNENHTQNMEELRN